MFNKIKNCLKLEKYKKKNEKKLVKNGFFIDKKNYFIKTPDGITFKYKGISALTTLTEVLEVFLFKEYEFFFKDSQRIIVFDAGVNMAASTLFFANKNKVKKVYAFEPFKSTCIKSMQNIALNPNLKDKVELLNYGLGNSDRIIEVPYDEKESGGMSTTCNVFDLNKANCQIANSVEKVEIKDSYNVLSEILKNKTDEKIVLKIDTEGAEFEIIDSLEKNNYLQTFDLIMMEYHFKEPIEILNKLTDNNFICIKKETNKKNNIGMIYAIKQQSNC